MSPRKFLTLSLLGLGLVTFVGCADDDSGGGADVVEADTEPGVDTGPGGDAGSDSDGPDGDGAEEGDLPDPADADSNADPTDGGDTPEDPDADADTPCRPVAFDAEGWGPEQSITWGEYTLDPTNGLTLFDAEGSLVVDIPWSGFEIGLVEDYDPNRNYDPWFAYGMDSLLTPPDDIEWISFQPWRLTLTEDSLKFALSPSNDACEYAIVEVTLPSRGNGPKPDEGPGRFRISFQRHTISNTAYFRVKPRVTAEEAFYGLGEVFDDLNHRGHIRPMQLEVDFASAFGYGLTHAPIPFFISTRGWGLFVESRFPGLFGMAAEDDEEVEAVFGPGTQADKLILHLYAASNPLDVTKQYYETTGYPVLPAPWAMGPLLWRNANVDEAEVRSDINSLRDLDLPHTGMWIDRPYASAVNTFDWSESMFDDPQGMIDEAKALGLPMGLWHTPVLDEEHPAAQPFIEEVVQQGYYPPQIGIVLNSWGPVVDITNPELRQWWQSNVMNYIDQGIRGFKLDFGEDVVIGYGPERIPWEFWDGSDERTMHSEFQLHYHSLYRELLAPEESFLICRAATYGSQTLGIIIWPGDLDATFGENGEEWTKNGETFVGVGGLPASIIAGISLGPSGLPFYGSDTGGYNEGSRDKELFTRWFEQTAFSPVMQIGTGSSEVAWEFDEVNQFDEEMVDWYRIYTRMHLRLWPMIWSYAHQLLDDGRPIQRAFGLVHPELGVHPWDEYYLGEWMLVAPVVERDATTRDVLFPEGSWIDWWTGETIAGGATLEVDAPLGTIPVYLAAGGIVPMLRPTIDALAPTTEPDRVDSFATTPGELTVRIAPGPATSFEMYDGTEIEQSNGDDTWTATLEPGEVFQLGLRVELIGITEPPADVADVAELDSAGALERAETGWWHDNSAATLWIKLPAGSTAHSLSVTW